MDEVLAHQPGRRLTVRSGDVVVKTFEPVEAQAFAREVAGLRALVGTGLSVPLVEVGELRVTTAFVDAVIPMRTEVGNAAIHRALGAWLARLHECPPVGMAPWSVVERLRARLAAPPRACPSALAAAVGRMVEPLLELVTSGAFVHGDWGTANVLVRADAPAEVLAIIDLEDAHAGDPAEDFTWQVLAGPRSEEMVAMASAYVAAGGSLGAHAVERLVVAGAERCLDVLGWDLEGAIHARCVQTLDELVSGVRPAWPTSGRAQFGIPN